MADIVERVTIEVRGLDRVLADLDRFGEAVQALPLVIGQTVREQTLRRFIRTKSDPDGKPWAPLSKSTLAKRRGKVGGVLVDTGRLMNSISAWVEGGAAVIGTNVFYGQYHHTGTRRMPMRRFLGVGAADERELLDRIDQFLFFEDGQGRAGGAAAGGGAR